MKIKPIGTKSQVQQHAAASAGVIDLFWLQPLVDFWLSVRGKDDPACREILSYLDDHPVLKEVMDDISVLREHTEFLERLVDPVFQRSEWAQTIGAVTPPFSSVPWIVATPKYAALLGSEHHELDLMQPLVGRQTLDRRLIYSYKAVLKRFYQIDMAVDEPVIASVCNKQTGLKQYFKLKGDLRFVDILSRGPLKPIDQATMEHLLDQPFDKEKWMEVLPIDMFLFRGLNIVTLVDVTIEEATNRLQYLLLSKENNSETVWMEAIREEMRTLFRQPALRLGIATLQRNGRINDTSDRVLWNSLLIRDVVREDEALFAGSPYHSIIETGQTITIEDISSVPDTERSPFFARIAEQGFRNYLLTPLMDEGTMIGMLEFASPEPSKVTGLSMFKINRLKPLFTDAVRRHAEEFESRVKATMLEQFTTIHPTIQWKFRDAAIQVIDGDTTGSGENIVFQKLYPFYGSLDIRHSSRTRGRCIRWDLKDNLAAAREFLALADEELNLVILRQLLLQVNRRAEALTNDDSDDQEIARFIREKINPVTRQLQDRGKDIQELVLRYHQRLDENTGIFTYHRSAYEQALALLNGYMMHFMSRQETTLSLQMPCYIDKYKTDGVEYNMYCGSDIASNFDFNLLYLENLQLQQLIWTCQIVREVDQLQDQVEEILCGTKTGERGPEFPDGARLHIAPLILVYSDPITLKFRMDEKRLDVDGSYNMRYEIVKKRIDKAHIARTGERLTQPGHIAIIYGRQAEASAYAQHLDYLVETSEIEPEWEDLELAELPDVDGMRAIRVRVRMDKE